MTKIQQIWFALNQAKRKKTASAENPNPDVPTENSDASAQFDGNTLRFLNSAEFVPNADGKSYTVVYNGLAAEFRGSGLFFG